MKILLVDDNEDLANNIADILLELGYPTFVAFDAKSAIDLCRSQPFDLILVDYKLPDMDGLRLQERLSEIIDANYVIITARDSIDTKNEAISRENVVGYVTKPLDIRKLLALIRKA